MADVGLEIPLPMITLRVFCVVKLLLSLRLHQSTMAEATMPLPALLLTPLRVVDLANLLAHSLSLALAQMMESALAGAVGSTLGSVLVLSSLWNVMVDVVSVTRPPTTMLRAVFVVKRDARSSPGRPTEYNHNLDESMMGSVDYQRVLGSARW